MKANINITYRDKENNIITNPYDGEIGYSPETQKLYIYRNGEWDMIQGKTDLGLTMYDINKQLIAQLPALNTEQMERASRVIGDYIADAGHTFYMLLCRDINYYTLFHLVEYLTEPSAAYEVLSCAADVGVIKSVEETGDGAVEIWVEPAGDEPEPVAMYLFGYDGGVIECTV